MLIFYEIIDIAWCNDKVNQNLQKIVCVICYFFAKIWRNNSLCQTHYLFVQIVKKFFCPLIHTNHMLLYNGEELGISKNFPIQQLIDEEQQQTSVLIFVTSQLTWSTGKLVAKNSTLCNYQRYNIQTNFHVFVAGKQKASPWSGYQLELSTNLN